MNRKWLPHFAELIDRLSIHQLKEVFIPEHKEKYENEMEDILHDLGEIIKEKQINISPLMIRAIVVLAQINTHIWYNEAKARNGEEQDLSLLRLTHGLNGYRVRVSNLILEMIGESNRRDKKADCLAADFDEWKIGLLEDQN